MKNLNPKIKNIIYQVSALLIILAAVVHSFDVVIAKYSLIVGAIGFVSMTFLTPYPGKSIRGKRLFNIQVFAAILIAIGAYLMYNDNEGWVVVLLIAAVQTLYCAIMLPRAYKDEENEGK